MNQDKLDVVKQEMAGVNNRHLRHQQTKMGKFNSDDHTSTTMGKNPLEEMV